MKIKILYFLFLSLIFSSCFQQNEEVNIEENSTKLLLNSGKEFQTVLKNNSLWIIADKIKTKIISRNNAIEIAFDFKDINDELIKCISNKRETPNSTIFKLQLMCNGSAFHSDLIKGRNFSKNDSTEIFSTSVTRLGEKMVDNIEIPFYLLVNYPANSKVEMKIRIWQECFLGEEIWKKRKKGDSEENYFYRDTLRKKLIDNTYTFFVTVPQIYKTNIVCDSMQLQNDKDWSPIGSDNTIWNSSLPDIYFSIADEFGREQSSSHIEKSSCSFIEPDTLSYYHYSKDEVFSIGVYDHDNLSNDDVLGVREGKLSSVANKKRYLLKFGHIDKFYFKKLEQGLQN